jgi:hypothetical protein
MLMVLAMGGEDDRYDTVDIRNYALVNVIES